VRRGLGGSGVPRRRTLALHDQGGDSEQAPHLVACRVDELRMRAVGICWRLNSVGWRYGTRRTRHAV
jgi:hypothetical protein